MKSTHKGNVNETGDLSLVIAGNRRTAEVGREAPGPLEVIWANPQLKQGHLMYTGVILEDIFITCTTPAGSLK